MTKNILQLARVPWAYHPVSAPINYTLSVYLLAAVLHLADVPAYWTGPIAVVVTFVASFVVMIRTEHIPCVAYTMVTGVSTCGWLTAVAWVWTPYSQTALVVAVGMLATLGPVYGLVRYSYSRRPDPVDADGKPIQAPRSEWDRVFAEAGYPQIREIQRETHRAGYTIVAKIGPKQTFKQLAASIDTFTSAAASVLKGVVIRSGAITLEPDVAANVVRFVVDTQDVLSQTIWYDMTDTGPTTITDRVHVAVAKDGEPLTLLLPGSHMQVIGMTGSGKSVLLNVLLARATGCADSLSWVIALDKGLPLVAPWCKPWVDGNADRPTLDWIALTADEAVNMLLFAYYLIDYRQAAPRGGREKITLSCDRPFIQLVLEESPALADIAGRFATHRPHETLTVAELVLKIERLGRSEGIGITRLTQRGTVTFGGNTGDNKANYGIVAGLKVASPADSMAAFPGAMNGVDLSRIEHAGTVYVRDNSPYVKPTKGLRLDAETHIPELAERHSRWVAALEAAAASNPLYRDRFTPGRFAETERSIRNSLAPENSAAPFPDPLPPATGAVAVAAKPRPTPSLAVPELPAEYREILDRENQISDLVRETEQYLASLPAPGDSRELRERAESVVQPVKDHRAPALLQFLQDAGADGVGPADVEAYGKTLVPPVGRSTAYKWLQMWSVAGLVVNLGRGRWAVT